MLNNVSKQISGKTERCHGGGSVVPSSVSDLQEVLHTFGVIAVTLTADSLHFFNLTRLAGGLDVFEVDLWILAEVHNRTQEVEQT